MHTNTKHEQKPKHQQQTRLEYVRFVVSKVQTKHDEQKPPGSERSECVGRGGERSECAGRGGERTQCVGRGDERRECVRRGGDISVVAQNDFCAETQWQQIRSYNLAKNQTKTKLSTHYACTRDNDLTHLTNNGKNESETTLTLR